MISLCFSPGSFAQTCDETLNEIKKTYQDFEKKLKEVLPVPGLHSAKDLDAKKKLYNAVIQKLIDAGCESGPGVSSGYSCGDFSVSLYPYPAKFLIFTKRISNNICEKCSAIARYDFSEEDPKKRYEAMIAAGVGPGEKNQNVTDFLNRKGCNIKPVDGVVDDSDRTYLINPLLEEKSGRGANKASWTRGNP